MRKGEEHADGVDDSSRITVEQDQRSSRLRTITGRQSRRSRHRRVQHGDRLAHRFAQPFGLRVPLTLQLRDEPADQGLGVGGAIRGRRC